MGGGGGGGGRQKGAKGEGGRVSSNQYMTPTNAVHYIHSYIIYTAAHTRIMINRLSALPLYSSRTLCPVCPAQGKPPVRGDERDVKFKGGRRGENRDAQILGVPPVGGKRIFRVRAPARRRGVGAVPADGVEHVDQAAATAATAITAAIACTAATAVTASRRRFEPHVALRHGLHVRGAFVDTDDGVEGSLVEGQAVLGGRESFVRTHCFRTCVYDLRTHNYCMTVPHYHTTVYS